jgi:hypothetical protein
MPTCKNCKEIYSIFDMANGICKNCLPKDTFNELKKLDLEQSKNEQRIKDKINNFLFFREIKIIFILIVTFLLFNGVLYIGQELYYKNDMNKCELLKEKATNIKNEIQNIEISLNSIKTKINRANKLNIEIKNGNMSHFIEYTQLIKEISQYDSLYNKYKTLLDKYNIIIDKYNKLASKAYKRYYLIPIPGHKAHHF